MALKASERSALTRILNNRFKVLKEELEEKILLGQIETTEAQALLASIPTVDGFLPTAKEAEALLSEGDPQPEVASKPAKKRAPAKKK